MDHPLYIAPDEEIISVIARLRSIPEAQITLVFPKHSVVTQSIINLKLLAREGEKLQKTLTLVSQNENARNLAEKIGFNTLPYTQEMEKGSVYIPKDIPESPQNTSSYAPPVEALPESFSEENSLKMSSANIGSQSFYNAHPSAPLQEQDMVRAAQPGASLSDASVRIAGDSMIPPAPSAPTTLRIRNVTPDRPPGLNSLRQQEQSASVPDFSTQSTVSTPIFPDSPSLQNQQPVTQVSEAPTAIKEFFNRRDTSQESTIRMPQKHVASAAPTAFIHKKEIPKSTPVQKKAPVSVGQNVSSKLTWLLLSFAGVFCLALASLGFFLIFPTASVTVNPQTITESLDQSFTVSLTNPGGEIPLEKSTQEITASVAGIASGAGAALSAQSPRAQGTLKISNNYNSEAQTLVASTRFEAPGGKIYRIQESISVPGNGSVEAKVVADGTGESYNLSEGTLTIPGFKGTDKYEKFSATIAGAITGGAGTETASGGTFIRADEETLRARATEEAKRIFIENKEGDTGDTHTFTDGLVLERVSENALPKVGSTPGEYEYQATFKVTAFTTSKEAVTRAIAKNIRSQYDGVLFAPITQELSFADFSVNEAGTEASLKAHLETTLAATLDQDAVKHDLAGKSAAELEDFTSTHPEIKALSIVFSPSWALKRIPSNIEKINLVSEL